MISLPSLAAIVDTSAAANKVSCVSLPSFEYLSIPALVKSVIPAPSVT